MENEAREITYLSVGLIIIALVLAFIAFALTLKGNLAQARNKEIRNTENIEEYREYNAYDDKTLTGDDVIELIRYKYNSGIDIFVDYRHNISTGETISTDVTCSYCGLNDNHRIYNLDSYMSHMEAPDEDNYFLLAQTAMAAELNDMRNWYPSDSRYRAYLVYNATDVENYYMRLIDSYYLNGGDSKTTAEEKFEALESGKIQSVPSDTVTGIILISYETLGL